MMDQLGRSKNAVPILRNTTKLTTRGTTSPDGVEVHDSHPGEEIYTPSGNEASLWPNGLETTIYSSVGASFCLEKAYQS